jgi:preprotein translocase subunit SecE
MERVRHSISRPLYVVAIVLGMSAWIWGLAAGLQWLLSA